RKSNFELFGVQSRIHEINQLPISRLMRRSELSTQTDRQIARVSGFDHDGSALRILYSPNTTYLYPWTGPMPLLKVEGDPYEMGLSHGRQGRAHIQRLVNTTWPALELLLKRNKSEIMKDVVQYDEKIKWAHSDFAKEMEGLARGAEVTYEDIVFLNSQVNILVMNSVDKGNKIPVYLCSGFTSWGSATSNGEVIACHNDDGMRITDQFLSLLDATPAKGFRFSIPIIPGYLGYHTVVNEAGLVAFGNALEYGPKPGEARIGVPLWIIFRYLGQFVSKVEEAIDYLKRASDGITMSFLLADKGGNSAIVHSSPNNHVVIRPKNDETHMTMTNHALDDGIKEHLVLRKNPSNTYYRRQSLEKAIRERYGTIDLDKGAEIMSTHYDFSSGRDNPSGNTPCRHYEYAGKFAGTCRSAVVNLGKQNLRMRVALGNPCVATWVELQMPYRDSKSK
ncbi:MAG: hypothetical protein JRN15_18830, partial [Nitrososphaerota archaeon]|nr:hypothetical protein [Nitrososphaerota archaeon]